MVNVAPAAFDCKQQFWEELRSTTCMSWWQEFKASNNLTQQLLDCVFPLLLLLLFLLIFFFFRRLCSSWLNIQPSIMTDKAVILCAQFLLHYVYKIWYFSAVIKSLSEYILSRPIGKLRQPAWPDFNSKQNFCFCLWLPPYIALIYNALLCIWWSLCLNFWCYCTTLRWLIAQSPEIPVCPPWVCTVTSICIRKATNMSTNKWTGLNIQVRLYSSNWPEIRCWKI